MKRDQLLVARPGPNREVLPDRNREVPQGPSLEVPQGLSREVLQGLSQEVPQSPSREVLPSPVRPVRLNPVREVRPNPIREVQRDQGPEAQKREAAAAPTTRTRRWPEAAASENTIHRAAPPAQILLELVRSTPKEMAPDLRRRPKLAPRKWRLPTCSETICPFPPRTTTTRRPRRRSSMRTRTMSSDTRMTNDAVRIAMRKRRRWVIKTKL